MRKKWSGGVITFAYRQAHVNNFVYHTENLKKVCAYSTSVRICGGLFFICVRTDTVTSEHVCVSVCRPNANCKTRTKGSTISL